MTDYVSDIVSQVCHLKKLQYHTQISAQVTHIAARRLFAHSGGRKSHNNAKQPTQAAQ